MNSYFSPAVTLSDLCRCAWWSYKTEVVVCGCTLEFVGLLDSPFSFCSVWNMTGYRAGTLSWGFFYWLFYCDVFKALCSVSVLLQTYSRSIKHTCFYPSWSYFIFLYLTLSFAAQSRTLSSRASQTRRLLKACLCVCGGETTSEFIHVLRVKLLFLKAPWSQCCSVAVFFWGFDQIWFMFLVVHDFSFFF